MWRKTIHGNTIVNLGNMDDVYLNHLHPQVVATKGEASYILKEGTAEECQQYFDEIVSETGAK